MAHGIVGGQQSVTVGNLERRRVHGLHPLVVEIPRQDGDGAVYIVVITGRTPRVSRVNHNGEPSSAGDEQPGPTRRPHRPPTSVMCWVRSKRSWAARSLNPYSGPAAAAMARLQATTAAVGMSMPIDTGDRLVAASGSGASIEFQKTPAQIRIIDSRVSRLTSRLMATIVYWPPPPAR
jgi:hypothetical protein